MSTAQPGDAHSRAAQRPGPWVVIGVLGFAGLTASLMQSIVIPFLPALPTLLEEAPAATGWVLTISLLTAAITMPVSGRLADTLGKRRIILILLGAQIVGSLIAAAAPTLTWLVAGRALQGVVLGVVPVAIALLHDLLPPAKTAIGVAQVSGTIAIGAGLGLPASAILVQSFTWRAPFLLTAVLALISLIATALVIPRDTHTQAARFDLGGAVTLAVGLTGILIFLSQGQSWGWVAPTSIAAAATGIAGIAVWVLVERRVSEPLVDLRVLHGRAIVFLNIAAFALGFALFASNVAIPQLLQQPIAGGTGFGLSLLEASLLVMPIGLLAMLVSPLAGALIHWLGGRVVLGAGGVVIAAAYLLAVFWNDQIWQIATTAALIGVGIGAGYAALPSVLLRVVPRTHAGAANSMNTVLRAIGTTAGSAVTTTVLATHTVSTGGAAPRADDLGFVVVFFIAGVAAAGAACAAVLLHSNSSR